jgi:acetoin utilization deacetylase AcuC-like enzyme
MARAAEKTVMQKNVETPTAMTGIVYDDIYLEHRNEPGHPESPDRLKAIKKTLDNTGAFERLNLVPPLEDINRYLLTVHTEAHVNSINKRYGHSHEVALAVVAGVLGAVDMVCSRRLKNAFCATRPPGHHALNTGREEGFCFYNAIAVAARYAQIKYGLENVLIVDWDYHHGNGTEAAFYSDPSVLYFSTHDLYAYPGTGLPEKSGEGKGEGYNINVPLDCGTTDNDILRVYNDKLVPATGKFKPDIILVSAGFDSRKDDLLGCFDITDQGFVRLTRLVRALADEYCEGRLVSVLEGGYNIQGNASAVYHHISTLME